MGQRGLGGEWLAQHLTGLSVAAKTQPPPLTQTLLPLRGNDRLPQTERSFLPPPSKHPSHTRSQL